MVFFHLVFRWKFWRGFVMVIALTARFRTAQINRVLPSPTKWRLLTAAYEGRLLLSSPSPPILLSSCLSSCLAWAWTGTSWISWPSASPPSGDCRRTLSSPKETGPCLHWREPGARRRRLLHPPSHKSYPTLSWSWYRTQRTARVSGLPSSLSPRAKPCSWREGR